MLYRLHLIQAVVTDLCKGIDEPMAMPPPTIEEY